MLIQMNLTQLKKNFLPVSYTLFLLGFFFFSSTRFHKTFFNATVAFPFLILIFMKKVALRSFFSNRTFLLSTIFLVYMFFTLFWGDHYELSDIPKYGRQVLYVLIFLGVTIHLIQVYPKFLQRLLLLLCWTAAIFAVGYIVFYYSHHPFPRSRLRGFGQLHIPIMGSSIYGTVFIACIYLLQQQRTWKMELLYLGMAVVLFLYMLLTQSRGPLLAWGLTILGWKISESLLYKGSKYNYRNKLWIAILLNLALGVTLFMVCPDFSKSHFIGRTTHRLEVWAHGLVQAKEAPCFGHGLNADTRIILSKKLKPRQHHHNVYVETLFYGGTVGLLLLIALVGSAISQGLTRTGGPQKFLLTCMLVFGALCMVTDGSTLIGNPKPFWFFFWFPIALIAASELPGSPLRDEERKTGGVGNAVSDMT